MDLLANPIKTYAWGSRTVIAGLLGRPSPSPEPEAEMWLGAHPSAPSIATRDGAPIALDRAIARSPDSEIGPAVAREFGARLPFLMKVLAAAEPLSLQAHPTSAQAAAGFDREEASGVALDAPERSYKDRSHKPELICALTPFDALVGFRAVAETRALFAALDVAELAAARAALDAPIDQDALRGAFTALVTMPPASATAAARATVAACARDVPRFSRELGWARRIGELYPGDIGVAVALLLNLVRLAPGEALYLRAGVLHAYLEGAGVEIMASSDNVLRGGLTPKHVDVRELLAILDFASAPIDKIAPRAASHGVLVYDTPTPEFLLSRIDLAKGEPVPALARRGPEIVLCVEGAVTLASEDGQRLALRKGQAAFVRAIDPPYALSVDAPRAALYRAQTGAAERLPPSP